MISACRASMPIQGRGIRISYTQNGAIIYAESTAGASANEPLKPFAVRWHQPENATGQWEIYMPLGCVSAGATATPLNAKASDTTGHDGDNDNWYVLPFSASPSAGDIYDVIVHAKQRAIDAEDLPQSGDPDVAPAALAWMQKRTLDTSERTESEKTAYAGDVTSTTVASITWQESSDGESAVPKVAKSGVNALNSTGTANQEFDLWWAFSIRGATLTVPKMGLLRRTLSTGTDVATIDDPVACEGASKGIYLRVALNDGSVELTVALDVNSTAAGVNFFIVQLYGIDQYHVASDFRSALWRLPMYLGGGS